MTINVDLLTLKDFLYPNVKRNVSPLVESPNEKKYTIVYTVSGSHKTKDTVRYDYIKSNDIKHLIKTNPKYAFAHFVFDGWPERAVVE